MIVMSESESCGIWIRPTTSAGKYSEYIIEKGCFARCVLQSVLEQATVDETKDTKRQIWEDLGEFAKSSVAETEKTEFDLFTEPQVVLEQSSVGESQSKGRVEGMIDRAKSHT